MTDSIPKTKDAWHEEAERCGIAQTQLLTVDPAFKIDSHFGIERILHLRILYEVRLLPKDLAVSSVLPKKDLEGMEKVLENCADASFLKTFLQDENSISGNWNVDSARSSGVFASAMECLHLIAKRSVPETDNDEGDDRTVKHALVAMVAALSLLLGYTGRVYHGHTSPRAFEKDTGEDLYDAGAAGLIMHLKEDRLVGFMKAKRNFRGRSEAARRQIAAQMADFIYE